MSEWWETFFDDGYYSMFYELHADPERTCQEVNAAAAMLRLQEDQSVLDLGCGWGRHCIGLAELGFGTTGVDYSERMIQSALKALARSTVPARCAFQRADFRALPFEDQRFDAAICMYSSFGFFSDKKDDEKVIREVARVLKTGARFLLDLHNHYQAASGEQRHDVASDHGCILLQDRQFDVLTNRTVTKWRVFRSGQKVSDLELSWRVYSPAEISCMMSAAGLVADPPMGDWKGNPFTMHSKRMIMVAERV